MLSPHEKCEQAKKLYWANERCDADHRVATLLYEAACSGCAEAMFLIDFWDLYYWCQGTQTRPSYWLRKASELGEVRANFYLAKCILTDKRYCETNGIETVREEALSLLRDAANAGISSAAYCLHHTYRLGLWDMEMNQAEAERWLRIAQRCKSAYSKVQLSRIHSPDSMEPSDWDKDVQSNQAILISERDLYKFLAMP